MPSDLLQMLWHIKMKMNYQSPGFLGPGNGKLFWGKKKHKNKVRSLTCSLAFFLTYQGPAPERYVRRPSPVGAFMDPLDPGMSFCFFFCLLRTFIQHCPNQEIPSQEDWALSWCLLDKNIVCSQVLPGCCLLV